MKYKVTKFYGLWLGFITVCMLLAQWFSVLTDAHFANPLFAIGFAGFILGVVSGIQFKDKG